MITRLIANDASYGAVLNPTSAFAQWCFGQALGRADRNGEALFRFDLALRLNPRGPMTWCYWALRASTLYQLKRYEHTVLASGRANRIRLGHVWPLVIRAGALGRLNREHEVSQIIVDLLRRRPGLTDADRSLGSLPATSAIIQRLALYKRRGSRRN